MLFFHGVIIVHALAMVVNNFVCVVIFCTALSVTSTILVFIFYFDPLNLQQSVSLKVCMVVQMFIDL